MKLHIKKATTDVTVYVFIQNSSLTTGAGLTGLVFDSASLVCYYVRPLGSATALTLATQTVTGAHSDGGFVEVSSANMPGVYRLDLSDAICATGVNSVVVMLNGAANMAPVLLEIQLVSYDPNDSVALGLTLMPSNVTQISGDSAAADNAEAAFDGGSFNVGGGGIVAASVTADVGITQAGADKVFGASGAAMAELGAVPSATPNPRAAIMLSFMALRNKLTTTATAKTLHNDAGAAIADKVLSDDGSVYTEDEMT